MSASKTNTTHYVDNVKFQAAMVEFKQQVKNAKSKGLKRGDDEWPSVTNYIGECFVKIATHLAYRANFIGYCVDTATQALTNRGWKNYDEITTEDRVLSYDQNSKTLVWSAIRSIYISEYDGLMHKLSSKGFDALVTPNHKFLTDGGIKPVEMLIATDKITLTGKALVQDKKVYSDKFVELVGWAVTEGYFRTAKRSCSVTIYQNEGEKADRIRKCLDKYKEYSYPHKTKVVTFHITGSIANDIHSVAPKKVITPEFINALTREQRILLIETMVSGDGWKVQQKDGESWRYCQKNEKHADAFSMLCAISGLSFSQKRVTQDTRFGKTTVTIFNIYKSPKLYTKFENVMCAGKTTAGGKNHALDGNVGKMNKPNTPTEYYSGKVWCLETEYGSFMCRRGKYAYLTGNSYRDEMISDGVENCLIYADNYDADKYKNPFAYFTQIVFFAFVRRIQKEKHQLELKYRYIEQLDLTEMITQSQDDGSFNNEFIAYLKEQLDKVDESKRGPKPKAKRKVKSKQ